MMCEIAVCRNIAPKLSSQEIIAPLVERKMVALWQKKPASNLR